MHFRERLDVPAWLWAVVLSLGISTATAVVFWIGPLEALIAGVVTAVASVAALRALGGTVVAVDDEGLHAGRSLLEWPYVGAVELLDAERTRALLGPEADARAFVVQKPWLRRGVKVSVEDAADPHPHWIILARRPERLAAALVRDRETA